MHQKYKANEKTQINTTQRKKKNKSKQSTEISGKDLMQRGLVTMK
jgi:hypothetical protein